VDQHRLVELLQQVRDGETDVDAAMERLRSLPFEDIGFATVDHHRALRTGVPEVIFAAGKTPEQVVGIAQRMVDVHDLVLVTRASNAIVDALSGAFVDRQVEHNELARTVTLGHIKQDESSGQVLVVAAGTSDLPVAEEALVTARTLGCPADCLYDVGVAGLHRLLHRRERLDAADVIVVVAGMEGALPSVVGGLVGVPVIAVPTSIGYGASFGGLAALLGMLNTCASGVTVVNIDNGFGAGYAAGLIARRRVRRK
jgi:hypothetical protein